MRKTSTNVTGRSPFDVTFRDFTKAKGRTTFKIWAGSPEEARRLGRIAAFHDGLLPDILDCKKRKA